MKKTDNFFLIHNFNTVPTELLAYCGNYLIVDASEDEDTQQQLKEQKLNYVHVKNTGHNITTYFDFFASHYGELPEVICICKGNMLGRHCSVEYFNRVYDNKYFTYLYEDKDSRTKLSKALDADGRAETGSIAGLLSECWYMEENTSWYVDSPNHPHRYFDDFDDLLRFIYKDPVIPKYCLFSPGACYIVRREQIQKHTPEFYKNLNKIMNYGLNPNFPSEAHMVERLLPLIFEAAYEENEWMQTESVFDNKLKERIEIVRQKDEWNRKRFKSLRRLFGQEH